MVLILICLGVMNHFGADDSSDGGVDRMSKKTSAIGKIYQALIYVFLYAPILVIGLFSFNGSANTYMLQGFSTHWYKELFSNAAAMHALQNTVVLALCTAAAFYALGRDGGGGVSLTSGTSSISAR